MEVVGSAGSHVGTVDKVRGHRILLTKSAKRHRRDEERSAAAFGDDTDDAHARCRMLKRTFVGTYRGEARRRRGPGGYVRPQWTGSGPESGRQVNLSEIYIRISWSGHVRRHPRERRPPRRFADLTSLPWPYRHEFRTYSARPSYLAQLRVY